MIQLLTFLSAVLGAFGSGLSFLGTYALEQAGAFGFAPENWKELEAARKVRNRKRLLQQRIGFLLILLAFVLQGATIFIPTC
jgi:hypothetical protein